MRRWSNESRQSLRFLAAARYYLPTVLHSPKEWEEEYGECLRYGQFDMALKMLERIGLAHAACADEMTFWKEMYFAAKHLGLDDHAERYDSKVREAGAGSAV